MHQNERAVFDLRRGMPVIVAPDDGESGQAVLAWPLEAIDTGDWQHWLKLTGGEASLVLTNHRLRALGITARGQAAALALDPAAEESAEAWYEAACSDQPRRALPTPAPMRPASAVERGALTLMRRALLIPAALIISLPAKGRAAIDEAVRRGRFLSVSTAAALNCFESGAGLLRRVSEAEVPLADDHSSRFILFREADGLREHVAVLIGDSKRWPDAIPVRLHSSCLTGDLFASLRCDCGEQLHAAVARIGEMGGGVLLYLAQEGRGIGLANKLRAYALQDSGHDTIDADQVLGFGEDERRYRVAVDLLSDLGIDRIHLLTNNPAKGEALRSGGIEVAAQGRLFGRVTQQNRNYLNAKASRSGHLLDPLLE
ncbi:MAG: GTP cyclohydrolase II RibA [Gammaproteobacteria bacterium]|nr:GTP cyclohydrolase II RibA [Gammaproteobacteria bacterium]